MQAEQTLQQVDTLSEALQASTKTDWSLLYRTPVYDIVHSVLQAWFLCWYCVDVQCCNIFTMRTEKKKTFFRVNLKPILKNEWLLNECWGTVVLPRIYWLNISNNTGTEHNINSHLYSVLYQLNVTINIYITVHVTNFWTLYTVKVFFFQK